MKIQNLPKLSSQEERRSLSVSLASELASFFSTLREFSLELHDQQILDEMRSSFKELSFLERLTFFTMIAQFIQKFVEKHTSVESSQSSQNADRFENFIQNNKQLREERLKLGFDLQHLEDSSAHFIRELSEFENTRSELTKKFTEFKSKLDLSNSKLDFLATVSRIQEPEQTFLKDLALSSEDPHKSFDQALEKYVRARLTDENFIKICLKSVEAAKKLYAAQSSDAQPNELIEHLENSSKLLTTYHETVSRLQRHLRSTK